MLFHIMNITRIEDAAYLHRSIYLILFSNKNYRLIFLSWSLNNLIDRLYITVIDMPLMGQNDGRGKENGGCFGFIPNDNKVWRGKNETT